MKRKKNILICDDNPDTLRVLTTTLNKKGWATAYGVNNGTQLLDRLTKIPLPDLLVIDLMLPDIEGDDITVFLRKHKVYDRIPILLISGVIINVDNRARAVKADDYLLKPFTLEEFEEKVFDLLNLAFLN